MDRRIFTEKQVRPVQRKITVDFVSSHLMETLYPVFPAAVHQHRRADDIRFKKNFRIFDAAVHMGFCREVNDDVRSFGFEKVGDCLPVPDISLHDPEAFIFQSFIQCVDIRRVRKGIQTDDTIFRMESRTVNSV